MAQPQAAGKTSGHRKLKAEPLKNQYGADVPRAIAGMISNVYPAFNSACFVSDALDDYPQSLAILLDSLDQPHDRDPGLSLASFLYLPHTVFVAQYGLAYFKESMQAQHALTQRFTAEFSIRPFLEQHPDATLRQLTKWTADPSPHVRRLVSEGTRPRLPWAPRLRQFQADPAPVLALLELLKDDPELYVRRSVANNLNDIGKDHPEVLASSARAWLENAPAGRAWIVGHALRSAVKRGESAALKVLGFGKQAQVAVSHIQITPARAVMGGAVRIDFELTSTHLHEQGVLVDLAVRRQPVGLQDHPALSAGEMYFCQVGDSYLSKGAALVKAFWADDAAAAWGRELGLSQPREVQLSARAKRLRCEPFEYFRNVRMTLQLAAPRRLDDLVRIEAFDAQGQTERCDELLILDS